MEVKPEDRFSGLVDVYEKYRPGYPAALLTVLENGYLLPRPAAVADVGSGTGKLSLLFLDRGDRVFAVEPNADMRGAAERLFAGRSNFVSLDACAERTGLPDHSTDLVIAGTAFHWFDKAKSKIEFTRVVKSGGTIALIWNKRDRADGFMREYDRVLKINCPEYKRVGSHLVDEDEIAAFFKPAKATFHTFPNSQRFDLAGLLGRLISSSYCLKENSPGFPALEKAMRILFEKWQIHNEIKLTYQTVMYAATMKSNHG
jgi:SAM-dependent methyltransferase